MINKRIRHCMIPHRRNISKLKLHTRMKNIFREQLERFKKKKIMLFLSYAPFDLNKIAILLARFELESF